MTEYIAVFTWVDGQGKRYSEDHHPEPDIIGLNPDEVLKRAHDYIRALPEDHEWRRMHPDWELVSEILVHAEEDRS